MLVVCYATRCCSDADLRLVGHNARSCMHSSAIATTETADTRCCTDEVAAGDSPHFDRLVCAHRCELGAAANKVSGWMVGNGLVANQSLVQ